MKIGGPPSKPKYYLVTDSELVPRGKDEIELSLYQYNGKQSEIEPEIKYLQAARGFLESDSVPFV